MGEVWPTAHITELCLQLTAGSRPVNGDEHRALGSQSCERALLNTGDFTFFYLFQFSHFSSVKIVLVLLVHVLDKTSSSPASFPVQIVFCICICSQVWTKNKHNVNSSNSCLVNSFLCINASVERNTNRTSND